MEIIINILNLNRSSFKVHKHIRALYLEFSSLCTATLFYSVPNSNSSTNKEVCRDFRYFLQTF